MNKIDLSERDICTKFITPAIQQAGWDIVAQVREEVKVNELMALCDRLESQLATTQTESRRLLEAVLHEALTPVV